MPREIEIVPYANNDLPSDYLFSQREYYVSSSDVYLIEETTPQPVDIWYEKPYWGKVDTKHRLVFPDGDFLVSINDDISVLNFVAEAYNDFRDFALEAAAKLRTSMTSFIDVANPKKGYDNVVLDYKDYFENTLDSGFVNTFLTEQDKSTIRNFLDYSKEYSLFAEVNSEIPHTLAGYLASPNTSYRSSGMIIEFADDDYSKDSVKWGKYLSNDFFNDYTRIAASFGFYVNKHVPWSIVANLNSSKMKNYMISYGFDSPRSVFNSMFFQAEYISYQSFKKYMFLSYASFISYRPRMEIIKYKNCIKDTTASSYFKTEREIELRPVEISYFDPTYSQFTSIYSDYTFLKLYTKIRLLEEKVELSKSEYNSLIYEMIWMINTKDVFDSLVHFSNFLALHRRKKFAKLIRKRTDITPVPSTVKPPYTSPCGI